MKHRRGELEEQTCGGFFAQYIPRAPQAESLALSQPLSWRSFDFCFQHGGKATSTNLLKIAKGNVVSPGDLNSHHNIIIVPTTLYRCNVN